MTTMNESNEDKEQMTHMYHLRRQKEGATGN